LNDEHRDGLFSCAGCGQPLFKGDTKFDSGTGWPSFFVPLKVRSRPPSIEIRHGANKALLQMQGHLGHVFEDGPAPTGLRYCMNGVSLAFKPAE
jgi:peptide-methionine (R)-S-oxide reductase